MINVERKILFLDITKTAGTSIINYFKSTFPNEEWVGKHHSIPNYTPDVSEIPVTNIHFTGDWKVFTVVRNPWDRLLSTYLWGSKPDWGAYHKYTWPEFIGKVARSEFHEHNKHRYRTQCSWLSDNKGNLRVPLTNILRYETLGHDFAWLCRKWDLGNGILEKVNTAEDQMVHNPNLPDTKGHYTDWYKKDELRDIVGELYREDIEQFEYKFGS